MPYKILLGFLLLMNLNTFAQAHRDYDTMRDPENGRLTYKGLITFNDLKAEPEFTWEHTGVVAYNPGSTELSFLTNYLKEYSIIVFMGTWCGDSHDMVPRLEKVLDKTGFPQQGITIYGVDRAKTTIGGVEKKYNVTLVPTVILFSKDGKEAGRVTETVSKSIEADLEAIIKKDKHLQ